jgi:hypothetical protein
MKAPPKKDADDAREIASTASGGSGTGGETPRADPEATASGHGTKLAALNLSRLFVPGTGAIDAAITLH